MTDYPDILFLVECVSGAPMPDEQGEHAEPMQEAA